jgi:hypothetical protein
MPVVCPAAAALWRAILRDQRRASEPARRNSAARHQPDQGGQTSFVWRPSIPRPLRRAAAAYLIRAPPAGGMAAQGPPLQIGAQFASGGTSPGARGRLPRPTPGLTLSACPLRPGDRQKRPAQRASRLATEKGAIDSSGGRTSLWHRAEETGRWQPGKTGTPLRAAGSRRDCLPLMACGIRTPAGTGATPGPSARAQAQIKVVAGRRALLMNWQPERRRQRPARPHAGRHTPRKDGEQQIGAVDPGEGPEPAAKHRTSRASLAGR